MDVWEEENYFVTSAVTGSRNVRLQACNCNCGSLRGATMGKNSGIAACVSRGPCEDGSRHIWNDVESIDEITNYNKDRKVRVLVASYMFTTNSRFNICSKYIRSMEKLLIRAIVGLPPCEEPVGLDRITPTHHMVPRH